MTRATSTEEFFLNTAHFASGARGSFRFTGLQTEETTELYNFIQSDTLGLIGLEHLKSGILAKGVQIGGQQLATIDVPGFTGPSFKVAYGQIFSDITVEFLLMGKDRATASAVYYALTKWHEFVAGPVGTAGKPISTTILSGSTPFAVRYYDSYKTDAQIEIFSPTSRDKPEISVKLTEAYPINIGPLQTSWDSPDAPLTCQVGIAYHYMQVEHIKG